MSFYGTCSIAYTHTQSHSMRYYAVLSCCTSRGLGAAHRGPPQFAPTKMALEEDPLMDVDDCGSEAGFTGDGDFDDAASAIQSSSAATSRGGKRRAAASSISDEKGAKRRKAVQGKKWCPAHGKYELAESFPTGSGQCGDGRKIIQNLRNAARAQNQTEWIEGVLRDAAQLKKTVLAYEVPQG